MKKYFLPLLMFIFSSFILFSSVDEEKSYTVSGTVKDLEGDPIPGVHVMLENTIYEGTTNKDGFFTFNNVRAGKYVLKARMLGFVPVTQFVEVEEGDVTLSIDIQEDVYQLPQLNVVGKKDHLFTNTPGSVSHVKQAEIQRLEPVSGNEVFRRVPGLHVVDEEGVGLRINLGVRGLSPDRSRNVLMLEDGIPIALNPYGEPEMYYTPSMDRMAGVEVLKGSGQVLYGPQTIGGVVNFITPDPPTEEEMRLKLQAGQGGFMSLQGSYGNTFNNTGLYVNFLRKQADEVGPTQFALNDLNAKIRIPISSRSVLGIKFSAYDEKSNSTYVGITQAMFDQGGNDYSVLAPDDELDVKRFAVSANHRHNLKDGLVLQSTFFGNSTQRNWRRQNFARNEGGNFGMRPADMTHFWGDESIEGGALYMRAGTGNRNRQFEVLGWEQKMVYDTKITEKVHNSLTVGYRYMFERAFEQRINGTFPEAGSGALINDEMRTGHAWSAYVLDNVRIGERFQLSPGVRFESYAFQRDIYRQSSVDTNLQANDHTYEIIPGLGANYAMNENVNIFSGVHRGFAPPRVKDAIDFTQTNAVLQLDAERSWNYEVGFRGQFFRGVSTELTVFYMDFENQIIPSSESVGGLGFGLVNAGETQHRGVELAIALNSRKLANTRWLIMGDVNATYVQSYYAADQFVDDGSGNTDNVNGNRLPFAPEWTISSAFTLEAPFGTGFRATYTYIGDQFTDSRNTLNPSANGKNGRMESYNIVDLTVYQQVRKWNTRFNLSVKNLLDERYIATRNPDGIRVGLPRFITGGFEINF